MHINSPEYRLIHVHVLRKRWLCPDMTEKLLTGTLNLNTNLVIFVGGFRKMEVFCHWEWEGPNFGTPDKLWIFTDISFSRK